MATSNTRITDISQRLVGLSSTLSSSDSSTNLSTATSTDTGTGTSTTTSGKDIVTLGGLSAGITPALLLNPTPLTNPSMLHQSVQLSSYDNTDPTNKVLLYESFDITFGNFTPSKLSGVGGNIWYLQFGTSNYGMKFHLPYGTNYNKMFITYCVKNSSYAGGHQDYVTSLTQAWIDAALAYCYKVPANTNPSESNVTRDYSASQFPTYITKTLFFYYKGNGVSSGVNSQGSFNVSFAFLNNQISVDTSSIPITR